MIAAAIAYAARGWDVVPLTPKTKRPFQNEWQKVSLTREQIPEAFRGGRNLGLKLGKPSGGLVDVDLDCPAAILLARELLPSTGMVHGRPGARASHWWYVCENPPKLKRFTGPSGVFVEFRSTGGQTVVPPSEYPKGGHYSWDAEGDPGTVSGERLHYAVSQLAAACWLSELGWPSERALDWVRHPSPLTPRVPRQVMDWLGLSRPQVSRTDPGDFSRSVWRAGDAGRVLELLGVSADSRRIDCPLRQHETARDSFVWDEETWFCHSCDEGGNTIHLAERLKNLSYVEARAWLAEALGVAAPPAPEQIRPDSAPPMPSLVEHTLRSLALSGVDAFKRARSGDVGKRTYTGIKGIDLKLRGFRPKQLTLLGARPSVGKTSLLLAMLLGAVRLGASVGFVSLEVSEEELRYSLLAISGRLDRIRIEDGKLAKSEFDALLRAAEDLADYPGSFRAVCPTRTPTPSALIGICRDMHDKAPLDLVAIDYIQRISTGPGDNKVSALESLSLGVCEFAKDTECHVLASAQLNRESEHRGLNAAPRMADLKGSGQFEQDAHNVLLLHRGNKDSQDPDRPDDRAVLLVAKQRNGPTGMVQLAWHGPSLRFSDRVWKGGA